MTLESENLVQKTSPSRDQPEYDNFFRSLIIKPIENGLFYKFIARMILELDPAKSELGGQAKTRH